jgi:hypothetical protein
MANRLNRGFSQLRDDELDNVAQSIINQTSTSGLLALPNAKLTAATDALSVYQGALAMPKGTAARETAVAEARATLEEALQKLAAELEDIPNVTDAQLATTGYTLRKTAVHTTDPVAAPANVRLKLTGTSGEVQALCDSVARAKTYQLQFTQDPNGGTWSDGGTFGNTRGMIIKGLTRAKDYWVRVRAIGPDGPGAWSDPATILVA